MIVDDPVFNNNTYKDITLKQTVTRQDSQNKLRPKGDWIFLEENEH